MPLYRYAQGSPIERVEIASLMGQPQAILHPAGDASPHALQKLRAELAAKNIYSAIDRINNEDVLVAHGLDPKRPAEFLKTLGEIKAIHGAPAEEKSPLDTKKSGLLKLSSYLYTVGNFSDMASGVFRAKHDNGFTKDTVSEFGVGFTFTLGDLVLMMFSEGKGTRKMQLFGKELARELSFAGASADTVAQLPTIPEKNQGLTGSISDWFTRNVLRVKGATETTAGFLKIQSGLGKAMTEEEKETAKAEREEKGEKAPLLGADRKDFNAGKVIAGIAIINGWSALALSPNTTPPDTSVPREKHTGLLGPVLDGVDAVVDYFRGDVRGRWTRPLAMTNNAFSVIGAVDELKNRKATVKELEGKLQGASGDTELQEKLNKAKGRQNDPFFNLFTQVFFISANFIYGMSGAKKKGVISEDERTEDAVITTAANLVLTMDDPKQRLTAAHQAGVIMRKMTLTNKSVEQVVAAIGQRAVEIGESKFANSDERKIAAEIHKEINAEKALASAQAAPEAPAQAVAKAEDTELTAGRKNYRDMVASAGGKSHAEQRVEEKAVINAVPAHAAL